ncbi:MAG: lamin tail domain-containing protein [Candidatus Sumerlaeaceae bacterium]
MPFSYSLKFAVHTATLLGLLLSSAASAQNIAITEYNNDTNGDPAAAVGAGEWFELYNYGTTTVTMTSWRMKDDDTDNVLIPTSSIAPKDFLILARNKVGFEKMWTGGLANARVVQYSSGTFLQSDLGDDELVLYNATPAVVWRLAYGPAVNSGSATYYAETDFTRTNHGTKTAVINRGGPDTLTSDTLTKGYEGQEHTPDPWAYSGGGDVGSPLRGDYPGANNPTTVQPTQYTLNLSGAGTSLNPGVRGIAIADQSLDRGDNSNVTGIIPCVERVTGSALRGVSGGLNADIYDWKTRNAQPRPTTLQFMKWTRDSSSTLYITANIRGLTEPDPNVANFRRYYTTDTTTLANLAADWVRYTNRIVQIYRQGDVITDARDASILNSLTWNSSYVSPFGSADNYTTLPAVGETPVPKVTYWEIGNEPLISLANAYSVTNAFTFSATSGVGYAEWVNRYIALSTAMVAEDPTIKVGPCIVGARNGANANILTALLQSAARIDFIAYHPYGSMGDYAVNTTVNYPNSAHWQQAYLGGVHREQELFLQDVKNLVATYRPGQVNTMEYAATETNVSDFRTNNQFQEGTMAHALGSAESVFSWGRLGLSAAHYWIWITAGSTVLDDSNRMPVSMAFEKLRDKMGNRLLGSFDAHDRVRVHVVGDTTTNTVTVWATNFSNTTDIPFQLSLTNGSNSTKIYKEVLGKTSGATNLFSFNAGLQQPFGPYREVDWSAPVVLAGANPANLNLTLPASTLTLLTIEHVPVASIGDWSIY